MQHLEEGTIHAWIDGALSPAESRDVEAHLATCTACRELAAEARGLVAASSRILTALDDVPSDVIPIAAPSSVASTEVRPIQRGVRRMWATPIWMRTAAAVVIVAGASALVWTAKLNSPETKSAMLLMDTSVVDSAEETLASATPDTAMLSIAASAEAVAAPVAPSANSPRVATRSSVAGKGATAATRPSATARGNAPVSADGRTTLSGAVAGAAAGQATAGLPGSRTEQNNASSLDRPLSQQAVADREDKLRRGSAADASAERQATDLANRREAESVLATRPASPTLHADTGAVSPPALGALRATLGKARRSSPAAAASAAGRGFSLPPALLTARGCYELTLSPWSGGGIPFGAPPPKIELDTIRSEAGDLLVHPGRGAASNGAPRAFWTQQGDSVYVTWENDTRGVRLALHASGSVLRGRAETISNGVRAVESQSSNVEARRISCRE